MPWIVFLATFVLLQLLLPIPAAFPAPPKTPPPVMPSKPGMSAKAMPIPAKKEPAVTRESIRSRSEAPSFSLDDLKMKRRFGIGLAGGGSLAILGIESDINLLPEWSLSIGLGTGIDYSSFSVRTKIYLPGEWVSPYLGAGVARWWSDGTTVQRFSPSMLHNQFLDGANPESGFNVWLVYPMAGVQFMTRYGFAVYAEFQYFFRLFTMASASYGGAGFHWFF